MTQGTRNVTWMSRRTTNLAMRRAPWPCTWRSCPMSKAPPCPGSSESLGAPASDTAPGFRSSLSLLQPHVPARSPVSSPLLPGGGCLGALGGRPLALPSECSKQSGRLVPLTARGHPPYPSTWPARGPSVGLQHEQPLSCGFWHSVVWDPGPHDCNTGSVGPAQMSHGMPLALASDSLLKEISVATFSCGSV